MLDLWAHRGGRSVEQNSKDAIIQIIAALVAGFTLCAASITMISLLPSISNRFLNLPTKTPTPQTVQTIELRLSELEESLIGMQKAMEAISQTATITQTGTAIPPQLALLNSNIDSFDDRLSVIERAVLDNPEKALELTLLKKELEQTNDAISIAREEMSRTFGLFQFLLGTIALGVLGLAVSNFIPNLRRKESKAEKAEVDEAADSE